MNDNFPLIEDEDLIANVNRYMESNNKVNVLVIKFADIKNSYNYNNDIRFKKPIYNQLGERCI